MDSLLSILDSFKAAVNSTFIVDARYMIFLEGIKNTLTITFGALLPLLVVAAG